MAFLSTPTSVLGLDQSLPLQAQLPQAAFCATVSELPSVDRAPSAGSREHCLETFEQSLQARIGYSSFAPDSAVRSERTGRLGVVVHMREFVDLSQVNGVLVVRLSE